MSKGCYYKPDGSLFVLAGANKMEGGGLITVLYGSYTVTTNNNKYLIREIYDWDYNTAVHFS